MIPKSRHLEYAAGYLDLGLVAEAREELDAIADDDQHSADVLGVRSQLYMRTKAWDRLVEVGQELAQITPLDENGWISWAFALRELNHVEEAKQVLLDAEPIHGKSCGVLNYNLACYACLLGEFADAKRWLTLAIKMDKEWKQAAMTDSDLKAMWHTIAVMK